MCTLQPDNAETLQRQRVWKVMCQNTASLHASRWCQPPDRVKTRQILVPPFQCPTCAKSGTIPCREQGTGNQNHVFPVCIYIYIYIYIYTYIYIYIHLLYIHIYTCIYTNMYMHLLTCLYHLYRFTGCIHLVLPGSF